MSHHVIVAAGDANGPALPAGTYATQTDVQSVSQQTQAQVRFRDVVNETRVFLLDTISLAISLFFSLSLALSFDLSLTIPVLPTPWLFSILCVCYSRSL